MTVEIGVLNKHGVALAADSAVTIGNGMGHYNTANKLFRLSKYQPVAIMVYNNAAFMECPMEIIIKEYRKRIKDDELDTLKDYWNSFQEFLTEFTIEKKLCKKEKMINYLCDYLDFVDFKISRTIDKLVESNSKKPKEEEIKSQIEKIYKDIIIESYEGLCEEDDDPDYIDMKEDILLEIKSEIKDKIDLIIGKKLEDDLIDILVNSCVMIITKKIVAEQYTGIVICGYGKNEIYPHLISNEFIGCYMGKIKKHVERNMDITDDNSASIIPFAQVDVIGTFMNGIDSEYEDKIIEIIQKSDAFEGLTDNKEEHINKLINDIKNGISEYSEINHWGPMINTVASAPKEELVQMAETLINLTSFRRKMTMDESAQTVGGPIDVLVITKGDGLIWIKRKKYFDKELNSHFFHNYNKL